MHAARGYFDVGGHSFAGVDIRVTLGQGWCAVLVDEATGAEFPTKATATLDEGRDVVLDRAIRLIEAYLEGAAWLHTTL